MFCDAHCHLLPRMDTGPSDVAESIAMIKAMSEAGTRQILVVAHYDPRCGKTVSSYLKQRAARQKQLNHAISLHLSRSLHMRYAAQIPLLPGISHSPHLMKLCVEGTNLLPITVYESTMKRWMIKDIAHMVQKRNITPIICHMERYALIFSDHDFKALASLPQTLFQLSAAALTDAKTMEKFEWMWETDNPPPDYRLQRAWYGASPACDPCATV